MLKILKKNPESEGSVDDGLGSHGLSSFEVETESPEGNAGKIKERKQEKQLLEDEREPNGQNERVSSAGAKFPLFLSLPADTPASLLLH